MGGSLRRRGQHRAVLSVRGERDRSKLLELVWDFVGLGAMGGNTARRLAGLGFTVAGYDISEGNARRSGDAGVTVVDSPAASADGADFVLSSVPDPAAIRRAYLGPDGVLTRVRSGMVLIDLSTIDPATWREVAAAAGKHGVA